MDELTASDDRALVTAVLERAPGAFERLIARHQKLVWHLVYRMVQHTHDSEELCQDVFLRVYRKLDQFRFDSALSTWIGRIAFSVASRHRQRKRLPIADLAAEDDDGVALERIGDDFDLAAASADQQCYDHVAEALNELPALQRTLVTLYHLDELGIGEIARITALPDGTVKNYLFRARQKLRQTLISRWGEQT